MTFRWFLSRGLAAALILGSSSAMLMAGQAPTTATPTYTPPKTPWGDPDIQGTFEYNTRLPLERPEGFEDRATLTEAEWKKMRPGRVSTGAEDEGAFRGGLGAWSTYKPPVDLRTSLIIDPPNGRIPFSAEGRRAYDWLEEYRRLNQERQDTWLEEGGYTRCITRAIPRLQQNYNGGVQIIQSPGYVTLVYEQLHTFIIPLDNRPTLDAKIRQWEGDARGRWDGNTLVVTMTNFNDKNTGFPTSIRDQGAWRKYAAGNPDGLDHTGFFRQNAKQTIQFKPISDQQIEYSVTTEDPTVYSRPWTFMLPWTKSPGYTLYEYACNEGNIPLEQILRTRRIDEINGHFYQPPPEK